MSGSSLKYFAKAKNSAAGIVSDFLGLLNDSKECAEEVNSVDESIVSKDDVDLMGKHAEKIKGILDILQRNSMKVVFFGRTSNGKSTVINAMLKNKILPSGIGHTTNCFVQVEGEDGNEAYVATEGGGKQSVQSLSHLASALSKVKLTPESLIRIHWPKNKCHLLEEDIILLDSPGIDLSADVDEWIDKFCLDADVFVLVANSESTIMQTEKNFFHRVSSRLSKPNIFIVNNRWDASAYEIDTKKEVRQQHIERCTSFLVDELQVLEPEEIDRRVFFISALDTLQFNNSQFPIHHQPSEGIEERLDEFVKFEKCFEDCISRAAVETKFTKHARNVASVAQSLMAMWDDISAKIDQVRSMELKDFENSSYQFNSIENDFTCWQEFVTQCISNASEHLKSKMSQHLNKELKYLCNILDEYGQTFDPENEETMRLYRKDLNFYVEENLTKNLHISYTPVARATFLETCQNMIAPASSMLLMTQEDVMKVLSPGRNFEVTYNLDCTGLCSEFIEDIEFRFSLGATALLAKYLGKDDDYEVARMVGPRVLGICLTAYASLYAYERLSWTTKMKEQTFKRQYISFVTHQLRAVMDILASNCSQQVERELNSVMKDLEGMIAKHQELLKREIQQSEGLVKKLENISASASSFRSKFHNISNQLEEFQATYLGENLQTAS